ncbi:type II secretion system protein [bacterium]|nr:type II secretion system protein [bacterium]
MKQAFTLAEVFLLHSVRRRRTAFTLAEVLITLGIIGVVAAITLPVLIQNHRKHVVETRLAKFYTTINQAIQMSETVNGDKKYWDYIGRSFETGEDGLPDYSKSQAMAWFNKYLKPYMKFAKAESFNSGNSEGMVAVYFLDGSLLNFSVLGWYFYPYAKDFKKISRENGTIVYDPTISGTKSFPFLFSPADTSEANKHHYNKGLEPYMWDWDGDVDTLKNNTNYGCSKTMPRFARSYCTPLIMFNGWKIPKDYPLKF